MKDFLGRELKNGDYVVSKPGGRYAQMREGIIINETTVWFAPTMSGGSDIVLINTDGNEDLQKRHQRLLNDREAWLKESAEKKKSKAKNRIKKKDFKRFGVYSKDGVDTEIYLGKCEVSGVIRDNVWLGVRWSSKTAEDVIKSIRLKYRLALHGTWHKSCETFRYAKFPLKLREHFVLEKEDVLAKIKAENDAVNKREEWFKVLV